MSFPALSWAVRQKLPSTQKLVLLMLAERHNKDSGQCNPSLELLADDCGLSRRSVIDQIAKLQDAGYLTVRHRAKDSVKLPSQYVLHLGFGVPEKVQTEANDPYLLPQKVVNDVHQGSERAAPGWCNSCTRVVNVLHQGSERAAHKPGIEPGIEPVIEPVGVSADAPTAAPPAKPEKKKEAVKAAKPSAISKPEEVTGQVWADFLQIRKAKRSPLTATALAGIEREAAKAGIGLQQALEVCCESGWAGFKADWYANRTAQDALRRTSRAGNTHKHAAAAAAIFEGVWEQ